MNLKIIKLIVINIIILNCLNLSFGSELMLPKSKPLIQKNDIQLNKINYLLPKKKPILANKDIKTHITDVYLDDVHGDTLGVEDVLPFARRHTYMHSIIGKLKAAWSMDGLIYLTYIPKFKCQGTVCFYGR